MNASTIDNLATASTIALRQRLRRRGISVRLTMNYENREGDSRFVCVEDRMVIGIVDADEEALREWMIATLADSDATT